MEREAFFRRRRRRRGCRRLASSFPRYTCHRLRRRRRQPFAAARLFRSRRAAADADGRDRRRRFEAVARFLGGHQPLSP